ncbi:MFS transporter [Aporhodopirellula aestuarii]|uniref:MFS transporter n=1 Tax=Aporhodopirellula aestuarii TaxID=2950107 RepID=A0ABT0UD13_9BACT|nr:MFS transporter [Aporhodopirellula aestuarii]MCM2374634.1 MFS transporter [Aporhodopirellula aestuarii]
MDRILTRHELADLKREAKSDPNLGRSMADAACFGGMVGCGESYFAAFALAIGLSETASGIVASVPLLVGGVLQLVSPMAIKLIGGYRRWIATGAALQALAFLPLAFAAWNGTLTLPMMLLIASVYWAAGLSTGPAWNTWIEQIVPTQRRARFFAKRSRLQQTCTFSALMIAGVVLHWTSERGIALLGFAGLFCLAAVLRLFSAAFLHLTREPTNTVAKFARQTEKAKIDLANTDTKPAIRLLAYLVAMQIFIQLSGPYFVPYMLGQLELGYGAYVSLVSLAFLSKVTSLAFWGRIAEKAGATKVLWFGGIGLVPLSSLWIISTNVYWLAVVQITSGFMWAAYELGFFLLFFEMLPASQRTRLLTYYNFANALAMTAGALTGAAILSQLGCESQTYYYLFGISSIGRMCCVALLASIVLPNVSLKSIRMRILSVRLGAGSVSAPIVASAEET